MSKYLSLRQIRESIDRLKVFHVFFDTTFLVLKRNEAPVGDTLHIALDAENREHLRKYFRLHPKSDYFFTPFQIKINEGRWRGPKYASTSLQAINTQAFGGALIHQAKDRNWGWSPNYLRFLESKLPGGEKLPLLHLSIWMFREEAWPDSFSRKDVIGRFIRHFHISKDEIGALFDLALDSALSESDAFQEVPVKWDKIIEDFDVPPDVPAEESAILRYLEFFRTGPA